MPEEHQRIADRLALARRAGFIGRGRDCALFEAALRADRPPAVVPVHGAGGVGKTTLLREFARLAAEAGRPVIALDARHVRPSRQGLLEAFAEALNCEVADPQHIPVSDRADRAVVLIDTYERLRPLDPWIRDTVLPSLPAGVIVVLAGRDTPAREWSADAAWTQLACRIELQNFSAAESASFLAWRGVADAAHAGALDFTHGHPLALSLVADVIASSDDVTRFDPLEAPDVVRHLLEVLIDTVPADCRDALDVSAVARVTSERLLTDLLGADAGRRGFDWLRAQPFIESSAVGLFPHDLAREVLLADARWRDPDRLYRLARRIYSALHRYIANAVGAERQRVQMDALYVTRTTPTNVSFFDWRKLDAVSVEIAAPEDGDWIIELVHRHEGAESAALARAWWGTQPDAFHVFHDASGARFGFLALVDITGSAPRELRDPAVDAANAFVARHAPVGPGERVIHLRWWMHAEAYQAVTAAINLTAMHVVSHCVTVPGVAWNFVAMRDAEFWAAHFDGVNFARVRDADFEVGSHRYGAFAHEWRIDPPADWLMATRTPMPFGVRHKTDAASVVLGEADFLGAVRSALRDYTRPDALADNPLRFSRLLRGEADPRARIRALQQLLREAAETLDNSPRDQKLSRVIRHTYFEPLATQELAAERLNLPFSTYRHHLRRAIERIGGWLWLRETAAGRR